MDKSVTWTYNPQKNENDSDNGYKTRKSFMRTVEYIFYFTHDAKLLYFDKNNYFWQIFAET